MPDILLFVEDSAQEKFLSAMLVRLAGDAHVSLHVRVRTAQGGIGRVLGQLESFAQEVERGRAAMPDGLVVALDANCKGFNERRKGANQRAGKLLESVILAIPDPHIERWFLLDSEAFKEAVGRGCKAPGEKCEKQRYKRLLNQAVLEAGVQPLLGGVEYAEELAKAYNIQRVADTDVSFGRFVADARSWLNRFRQ